EVADHLVAVRADHPWHHRRVRLDQDRVEAQLDGQPQEELRGGRVKDGDEFPGHHDRQPSLGCVTLKLGTYDVNPPVVLAPMAGITNVAFRRLCREQGGGVYVCEMITTRALVERIPKTLKMIAFAEDEGFRSLQLYGVDPDVTAAAVRMIG